MSPEQAAAFVNAQAVCALARIQSMCAANSQRPDDQPFSAAQIDAVPDEFGIGHNLVLALFRDANAG